jgi:hypothetical protein
MNSPTESEKAERCNQCGQEIIEIDNGGMRLIGCLTTIPTGQEPRD